MVHDSEDAAGLLVERFDRVWNQQSKTLERLHQEDACQFLNRYPQDKYRVSCAEIAEGLSVCSAALPARGKFLELVAFSYVICNGDLHAKNISIIETPIGLACSPAYDLLSTLPYGDRKMALKMEGRDDNFKRRDFVNFGKRIGLSRSFVEGMLERLTTQVSPWIGRLSEIGLSKRRRADLEVTMKKRVQEVQVDAR